MSAMTIGSSRIAKPFFIPASLSFDSSDEPGFTLYVMTTGAVAPGACVAKKEVSFGSTFTDTAAVELPPGCTAARHVIRTAVIKSSFLNMAVFPLLQKRLSQYRLRHRAGLHRSVPPAVACGPIAIGWLRSRDGHPLTRVVLTCLYPSAAADSTDL